MVKRVVLCIGVSILISCGNRERTEEFDGTAWGRGAFDSNGERIYFTATSERNTPIRHTGFIDDGMMMHMGRLACASCHGPDARGGRHRMHMHVMDAPDIRWSALSAEKREHGSGEDEHGEYTIETFRMAVIEGKHPDGAPLSRQMPRWEMSEADLRDLAEYLQSLP